MLAVTLSLVLVLLTVMLLPCLKRLLMRMAVPGPLLPKGIKGNMPDYLAEPRKFGPSMVKQHGPLYRVYTTNLGILIALADPVLTQHLFQHQANMGHPWDLGLGHFLHRYLADSMGLANGRR